jgi:hypothetical protein
MPRQTLSESVLRVADRLAPLAEQLKQRLMKSTLLFMDETRVQVLNEPGKTPQSHSYMWVQRGGPPDKQIVQFHYDPGRSTDTASATLYGLIETAKANGKEPYSYLSWLFERLPGAGLQNVESLMPWNMLE